MSAWSTSLLCGHLLLSGQVDALHMSHNGHHEVIHCVPQQHINHTISSGLHHQIPTQKIIIGNYVAMYLYEGIQYICM